MEDTLKEIKDRDDMIRFFNGYSLDRKEELDEKRIQKGLVKSYMFETLGNGTIEDNPSIRDLFDDKRIKIEMLDENLYRVMDRKKNVITGFMEDLIDSRYFSYYTKELSQSSDKWMNSLVRSSPYIDHVWLSGWTFQTLWNKIKVLVDANRYIRFKFDHESFFETDEDLNDINDDEDVNDEDRIIERRKTSFSMIDRKKVIAELLDKFQGLYDPLYSITQLRFPSTSSKGGHDFFFNGKVTNRSDNFRDHREHLLYVLRIYNRIINQTEEKVWFNYNDDPVHEKRGLKGSPLRLEFSNDGLSQSTFDRFIESTFKGNQNRFRLWGNPIRMGPSKVHVYGLDQHLWQPIQMEITTRYINAIIPKGTCGNTVHRLVTNVQRFLDPSVRVYLGEMRYEDLIERASRGEGDV